MFPRLVDLCLKSIAENLTKHNLLFTTSDDFHTKRKLEFLQKKYSPDLISRLCSQEDGLPVEFIDLLLNKYTKFLDTSWFKKCPVEKLTSKLAEIGCNLEEIFCNDECVQSEFPEAIKDSICHLINLRSFIFRFKCDDWILKNVAKFCPHIEEIDVEDSPITSEGARYLCRDKNGKLLCTALKKICLGSLCHIEDRDVEYLLRNVPSLEMFDYQYLPWVLYSLHKENLASLDKVAPYNITALTLIPCENPITCNYANVAKICASVCPRLKIFFCIVKKQEELSLLFNLPVLEQLRIFCLNYEVINLNIFLMSKGSRLTSLSLWHCTVSVSVLAENCPCLKELILYEANILCNEDSKPVFNSLSSLTFMKYCETIIAKGMTQMLSSSSLIQLESFSFKNCDLEFPELKGTILKCCEFYPIKNMAFDTCPIDKEFIKELLRTCRSLEHLTLYSCVNDCDAEDLMDFAKLMPNKPKISRCWRLFF